MIQIQCSSVVSANTQGGKEYSGLKAGTAAPYAPLYYLSHLFRVFFKSRLFFLENVTVFT